MQEQLTRLKAPVGAGTVHSGDVSYTVVDGYVRVPADVARELLKPDHGFSFAPEIAAPAPRKVISIKK